MQERWKSWYSWVLVALLVASTWVGWSLSWFTQKRFGWLTVLVLLTAFMVFAGWAVTGRLSGFLIDQRNRMSLSRLQLAGWTLVVVSAFVTAALARVAGSVEDPLSLAMQSDLWWLLGISTTSLVGTSLILKNKELEEVSTTTVEKRAAERVAKLEPITVAVAESRLKDNRVGLVVHNEESCQARFYDLITGDEVGNVGFLDIGKVQMLLFTVVVLGAYATDLSGNFDTLLQAGPVAFPELDDSMIALLGISHAGYLGSKAAPSR